MQSFGLLYRHASLLTPSAYDRRIGVTRIAREEARSHACVLCQVNIRTVSATTCGHPPNASCRVSSSSHCDRKVFVSEHLSKPATNVSRSVEEEFQPNRGFGQPKAEPIECGCEEWDMEHAGGNLLVAGSDVATAWYLNSTALDRVRFVASVRNGDWCCVAQLWGDKDGR